MPDTNHIHTAACDKRCPVNPKYSSYRVCGQCAAVYGGGEGRALDGTVLPFDVLLEHVDWCATDRSGEVGARPQALRPPVVAHQVGELLAQPARVRVGVVL